MTSTKRTSTKTTTKRARKTTPKATPVTFAQAFEAAFTPLRKAAGLNLVSLADLRAALPAYDRATFDRELRALRVANLYVLHTFDGRHGKLSDAEKAAQIVEMDRVFIFVARRDSL